MNKELLQKLARLHIITPCGIIHLGKCFIHDGITLMAIMRFAAHHYPDKCALISDGERFSYKELYRLACHLARILFRNYGVRRDMCIGLFCRNHLMTVLLLPALSRLGVRIKLINTDIAASKIGKVVRKNNMQMLFSDSDLKEKCICENLPCQTETTEDLFKTLFDNHIDTDFKIPHIGRGREISVFTGGSSGTYKEAPRRMSVFQFLPPLFALLEEIRIDEHDSVFIPLPIFHGFGLATLIISFVMGKKICLMRKFDAEEALKSISEEKIEVLSLVPAMLARLWQVDNAGDFLRSVKCIICGGDRLDKKWVTITNERLGHVLYNLFGTSEAGFFMIAQPEDLMRYEETTIGKPIKGVKCQISQTSTNGVGELMVCSSWAMTSLKDRWQRTGDLVFRNAEGLYFYRGRADKMVVCGGENVYTDHVEKVISGHLEVLTCIVFSSPDPKFGMVLNATIELVPNSSLTAENIKAWLRPRLSRAEMPHQISIRNINVLETGKLRR